MNTDIKIARKVNHNFVEEYIVVEDNILPQFKIDEGWVILEEIKPTLKEFQKYDDGSYDIKSTKVIKTYQAINRITLSEYKIQLINKLKQNSYYEIEKILPNKRQQNIALGVTYTEYTKAQALSTVKKYIAESNRVKALINAATTHNAVKTKYDTKNFPTVVK